MKPDFVTRIATVLTIATFLTGITNIRDVATASQWVVFTVCLTLALILMSLMSREPVERVSVTAAIREQAPPRLTQATPLGARRGYAEYIAWAGVGIVLFDLSFGPALVFSLDYWPWVTWHPDARNVAYILGSIIAFALSFLVIPFAVEYVIAFWNKNEGCIAGGIGAFLLAAGVAAAMVPIIITTELAKTSPSYPPLGEVGHISAGFLAMWTAILRKVWDANGWGFFALGDAPLPWAVTIFLLKALFFTVPLIPIIMICHSPVQVIACALIVFYQLAFRAGTPRY